MVMRANEQLARSALIAFNQVVSKNYQLFTRLHWDQVVATMGQLVELTLPLELAEFSMDESDLDNWSRRNSDERRGSALPSPRASSGLTQAFSSTSVAHSRPDFQAARYKCALQLLILHSAKDMLLNGILGTDMCALGLDHLEAILGHAERSATFARDFNLDIQLRTMLWKAGFLDSFENILLSKQESAAAQLTVSVLMRLHTLQQYRQDPRFSAVVDGRLRLACLAVLEGYIGLLEDSPVAAPVKRSLKAWPSVIALVFSGMTGLVKGDVAWIGELYEPALHVYKLDNGQPSAEAYTFLVALSHKYIQPTP
jgi:brefeldin A-inhibited guanine nucleotide-exchange protein